MATVEDVCRHVAGVTATEGDLLLVSTWVNARWKELAGTTTLKTLRATGDLVTVPVIIDGSVMITTGDTLVSGTGTSWDSTLIGRRFRTAASQWYTIVTVPQTNRLVLDRPYLEASGTTLGYFIIQPFYRLDPEARELGTFWHPRLRRPLSVSSEGGMGFALSSRFQISNVPAFVTEQEPDEDGVRRVEIYRYSRTAELIKYLYWKRPQNLGYKDELPAFIDVEAFREGVMVDVLRNAMWRATEEGDLRKAEIFRNDYRSQETRWMRDHKHRVIKKDSGAADEEFLLLNSRNHPTGVGADVDVIDDAWSQVWYGR